MSAFGLGCLLLAATVVCDLFNTNSRRDLPNLQRRCVRLLTWLPVAFAYAGYYLGRYNVPAINVPAVREKILGLSELQLGIVIASGMWSYALSAPVIGSLVGRMGGWTALQVGSCAAGLANLSVLAVRFCVPSSRTWPRVQ